MDRVPNVYIAAPLFSAAELSFNKKLGDSLAPYVAVHLPQEATGLVVDLIDAGRSISEAKTTVFREDLEAIRLCDLLLIVLDGRVLDEGASFELGFAYALGKRCIGLRTDSRQLLRCGDNPMISCALSQTFDSIESLVDWTRTLVRRDA